MLTDQFILCQKEDNKHYEGKWTRVKGLWRVGEEGCHFSTVVRKGLHDQGAYENRHSRIEGGSSVDILGKMIPSRANRKCPNPEAGVCLAPFEEQQGDQCS